MIKPPPPDVLRGIIDIFEERGVHIPIDSVEITTAALCHWLETTKRGHEYMAHLLQLDSVGGKSEKQYYIRHFNQALTREIKTESIVFLRGCVAGEEILPLSQIEIRDRERTDCTACGTRTVCAEGHNEFGVCSYCLGHSEDSFDRDTRKIKCDECTDSRCQWHSSNVDVPPEDYQETHYG